MIGDKARRGMLLSILRHVADTSLRLLAGVTVEETDTSFVVRVPALGPFWRFELSMEGFISGCGRGAPLDEFLSKEKP